MQTRQLLFFGFLIGIIGMLSLMPSNSFGQQVGLSQETQIDTTVLNWLSDLYEPGISYDGDSVVVVNEEFSKLFNDEEYRRLMYPATYSWDAAKGFIQKQELKKAFWFFINLYMVNDKNKEVVVKSILTYDKLFKMDEILTSTFATYSLTDPEIGTIDPEGHAEITAPHIFEKKLQALKEMLFYLNKYRTVEDAAAN